MNTRFASVLCSALAACSTQHEAPSEGMEDWQVVRTRCHFSFLAPPDLMHVPGDGIDSCVELFRGRDCTYTAGYGWYGDPLEPAASRRNYVSEQIELDGMGAKLARFDVQDSETIFFVGVVMVNVDPDSPDTSLTFDASCTSPEAREVATEVIRSVMLTR